MATWYSVATPEEQTRLAAAWQDAPIENVELCSSLLEVARGQVVAYAPAPGEDDDLDNSPPTNYVLAQLQQATNLWNAGRVSSSGEVGTDTFSFTPRPLDKTIRTIIRPIDGKPHVL